MIYTTYEMIRDCRERRPAGLQYFTDHYVPVMQKLLAHYGSPDMSIADRVASDRDLFAGIDPIPERPFVGILRQKLLEQIPVSPAPIGLEDVAAAFAPLTRLEKEAAWIETMRYTPEQTAVMLRMSPATVEKIRAKAADLLRGRLDSWSRTILTDSGMALGREAAAAETKDCLPSKVFLDVLDGRTTWSGREEMERHASGCWHCIDHFCRMAEVIALFR
jgi:hypothetical protein